MKALPHIIGIAIFSISTTAIADTQALEYNPTTDTTTVTTIPLKQINNIVANGNYAFALDTSNSTEYTTISFFDGKNWETPMQIPGNFSGYLKTFTTSNGIGAAISTSRQVRDLGPAHIRSDNYYFYPDAKGNYAWHTHYTISNSDHGRIWSADFIHHYRK